MPNAAQDVSGYAQAGTVAKGAVLTTAEVLFFAVQISFRDWFECMKSNYHDVMDLHHDTLQCHVISIRCSADIVFNISSFDG